LVEYPPTGIARIAAMRATVCELPDARSPDVFERAWAQLADHVHVMDSRWIVLPDMPFCGWFADSERPNSTVWDAAVRAHDRWEHRLSELAPAVVLGSRPVDFGNARYDECFVWEPESGLRSVHAKARFAQQDGREWSWYQEAVPEFVPAQVRNVCVGFMIGSEAWAVEEAGRYGGEHVHLIAMPRSSRSVPFEDWLERAKAAARRAHAYVLSSNRCGPFGGQACIVDPYGDVLGATSASQPLLTLDIEVSEERTSVQPVQAPAWIDPWETGVPPY
jgi:predicted amidohydrolase